MASFCTSVSASTSIIVDTPVCVSSKKTEIELTVDPTQNGQTGGKKRTAPRIVRSSVDVWLQYGSLYFLNDEDIECMEVSINDEEGNEVYSECIDIVAEEEAEINVDMLGIGSYTLEVTINGTVYSGSFNL